MKRSRLTVAVILLAGSMQIFSSCRKDEPCATCPPTGPDTTSHEFTWTIDTLGDGASSALHDVAIINDTLVYAVGEIYIKDSSGQVEPTPYCLAKWNGLNWKPIKLYYRGRDSQGNDYIAPLVSVKGVFAPNAMDVWLAPGSIFHWNGRDSLTEFSFNRLTLADPNATVEKLWGISSTNLYGVGGAGTIVHFNATAWQKLESGTTLDIRDIYGSGNEILAVASNDAEKRLLSIQGTSVSALSDSGLANSLYGIWFDPGKHYYAVGAGIHEKQSLSDKLWSRFPSGVVTNYLSGGVRGAGVNDVFVAGSFFEIAHFNGNSWHNYNNVVPFSSGTVGRLAIKGNLIITVGLTGPKAIAILGRRRMI
ncbi:MAG: hypothetical protein WBD36_10330 [Bacteroidota bacterium]